MKTHVIRIKDSLDLKKSITEYVRENDITAGYVATCVGGLSHARIRMPGAVDYMEVPEDFEILSVSGTLSLDGCHLHVAISDKQGAVFGGHLSTGCLVRLTAEVVMVEDSQHRFSRKPDASTGYKELVIEPAAD